MHVPNVFHVFLLKQYIANPSHVLDRDDTILVSQEEFQMEPEQILEIKDRQLRHKLIREAFVLWKHLPIEDASWENCDQLVAQFPHVSAWII